MNRGMPFTNWPALSVLFLGLFVLGCGSSGPEKHPVTGIVTYQGKPLPLGRVSFVPETGRAADPAHLDESGRYQLELPAGKYSVAVIAMPPRPGGRPDPTVEGGIDYTGVPEVRSLIPKKYNRTTTSGIVVQVENKKANRIDIHLK